MIKKNEIIDVGSPFVEYMMILFSLVVGMLLSAIIYIIIDADRWIYPTYIFLALFIIFSLICLFIFFVGIVSLVKYYIGRNE